MMSQIYCRGRLLDMIQRAKLFPSSKPFVDRPLSKDPDEVLHDFDELLENDPEPGEAELRKFVEEHFKAVGGELQLWTPTDWNPSPPLLDKVKDPALRKWAGELNDLWKILGRKMKSMEHPERHSIIPVSNPFIVPGDRFLEFYYWDSYWIMGGLLAVGMNTTVRGMLETFIQMVDKYGFIPNGGRIYFTGRSQPPLLTPMVGQYYRNTGDRQFIIDNIALMEKEYQFWIKYRTIKVKGHDIAQYKVEVTTPRPEGYAEDIDLTKDMSLSESQMTWSNVASACESGWDFSTRWFGEKQTLDPIKTRSIIPVDLNAYLCWSETLLADFYGIIGDTAKKTIYQQKSSLRKTAIDDLFWDNDLGAWFDLDLDTGEKRTNFYPSNLFPLIANCTNVDFTSATNARKIMDYVKKNKIMEFPGGIPSSLIRSGEQWDFPNAWSPLVHFFVESLASLPWDDARDMAKAVSQNWVASNHRAWKKYGHMYEKYNVEELGEPGSGGEYDVQIGFGWTNGVILMLLEKYGSDLQLFGHDESTSDKENENYVL